MPSEKRRQYHAVKKSFDYLDKATWVSPSTDITLVDGVLSVDDSLWLAYTNEKVISLAKISVPVIRTHKTNGPA